MSTSILDRLRADLAELKAAGLYKPERVLDRPSGRRGARRASATSSTCAPTTTSDLPTIRQCAKPHTAPSTAKGYGMASVRFICGTQSVHKQLEERVSAGFWEPKTRFSTHRASMRMAGSLRRCWTRRDAVISDALNHASIIDGIRLCKAQRYRYANSDMGGA
jgi:glycine C-acetyltransferase